MKREKEVYLHTKRSVFMDNSREHIVNTALNLFLQKSFKDVTMQELVANAGVSKGAFYHYFSSKEEIFEEVVMNFYRSLQIGNYDALSTNSLKEFYKNWIKKLGDTNGLLSATKGKSFEFGLNHYYLIFDAIRLLPSFKEIHKKQHEEELKAFIKIIRIAKKNKEITTGTSDEQLAKMFIFLGDGTVMNNILTGDFEKIKAEVSRLWDELYHQVKA